jgi:hypothetical protein
MSTTMAEPLRPAGVTTRPPYRFIAATALFMVGIAGLGAYVAQRQLATATVAENRGDLDHGRAVFELLRTRGLEGMRAQCRILVEDPRLKSTLMTEGIDEATVSDILRDLGKSRATGMLVVLTPDGHVFAESGAHELRGLDLSASAVVKKAQSTTDATVGSWVIGGHGGATVIDLSIMAIRFDSSVIAYLVVGQTVDQELLRAVAGATGTGVGIAIGNELTLVSDDRVRALGELAREAAFEARVVEANGERFVAALVELEQMGQARPRLAVIRALRPTEEAFSIFRWLLWLSPVLVLVAVVLATSRSSSRAS